MEILFLLVYVALCAVGGFVMGYFFLDYGKHPWISLLACLVIAVVFIIPFKLLGAF